MCLTFLLYDGTKICKDSTYCFPLNCDSATHPTPPSCNFNFDDTICTGQSTTYSYPGSTAGLTFNWTFTGGSPATATGAGPHTVTYATAGCFPVSLTVNNGNQSSTCRDTVCVVPPPVATVSQVGNALYAYPAALNYQWYVGPPNWQLLTGEVNQFFNPSFSTLFCVVVSNDAGCSDTACIDHQWVGIQETGHSGIHVYPSPADEWLRVNVQLNQPAAVQIRLVNTLGEIALEKTVPAASTDISVQLPLESVATGLYIIELRSAGTRFTERVFVQHH